MGKIKNLLIEAMETPIMDACSECHGDGTIEVDDIKPQNFNRDVGYIDTQTIDCPTCEGAQEVSRLCDCGEVVTLGMGHDACICEECADD
jgi:RecJ-like exonuclease